MAPDVSISTNLGGFINKTGIWGHDEEPVYDAMEDSPLKWRVGPKGQHIEMGIAEMNLVLLLGQLGLSWDFQRERLFPIGTLYDPFVMRALEGIVYSTYSGSRFVLAGTPSGISLSREGGAHQSIITPGIGIETPGLTYAEPCYARELEWLLLDALSRMQDPDGEALYLRLSTKPVDQAPFSDAVERIGEERLRADVVAGGFRLREPGRVRGPRHPRVLRRDRPGGARGGRAARRRGRGRGDRALSLLARPALPRLAGEHAPRPLRGSATRTSHLESLLAPGRAGSARRHGHRRCQPRARLRRLGARNPLRTPRRRPLRSDGVSSPRSTRSTGSTARPSPRPALVALEPEPRDERRRQVSSLRLFGMVFIGLHDKTWLLAWGD